MKNIEKTRAWNSLEQHVASAQSVPVFRSRLKTHLSRRCFPWLCCCAWEVTLSFSDTLIVFISYLLTYLLTLHTKIQVMLVQNFKR